MTVWFCLKKFLYHYICFLSSVFENFSLKIWDILAYNRVGNLLFWKIPCRIILGLEKCVQWTFFVWYNQSEKKDQKVWQIWKKQYFVAILKIAIPLTANWVFLCWFKCHGTPILLIAPRQIWCHFEALECIFHLSKENFRSFHQLTLNHQNRAFPNLWSTPVY